MAKEVSLEELRRLESLGLLRWVGHAIIRGGDRYCIATLEREVGWLLREWGCYA